MKFQFTHDETHWILLFAEKPLESWPKSGYSKAKAQKRADRLVGEMIRLGKLNINITYISF